ncbi:sensor histidine kinase [Paraclostridium bifermentans]|uniref:sensor histidine kinase n=1 Tax=Paraclostridium bifermentans TaxID=1490 RepID=UPI00359CA61F
MATKLKSNKNIISLIAVLIILIASIGMVLSYPRIEKDSEKFGYNIYDNGKFNNDLLKANYGLYYDIKNENSDSKLYPETFMLEKSPEYDSITKYNEANKDYIENQKKEFNQTIEGYSDYLKSDLRNLEYYAIDKETNKIKQNQKGQINLLIGKTEAAVLKDLKETYDYYIVLDYDDKGNLTIKKINGANKYDAEIKLDSSDSGIFNNLEGYEVKPIKNMTYVYGVEKDLKYKDSIYYQKMSEEQDAYGQASFLFINIAVGFVLIGSMILPYKELKEIKIINKVFKIPFEILIIIVCTAFMLLYFGNEQIIRERILDIKTLENNQIVKDILIYLISTIYWTVLFSIEFLCVVLLKHIIKVNPIDYIKQRSLICRGFRYIYKKVKYLFIWASDIKLGTKNNKKVITILLINMVVVGLLCSIWMFGVFIVPIYTIVLYIIINKKYAKVDNDYKELLKITKSISTGDLNTDTDKDLGVFNLLKDDIVNIQTGFKKAVDEEVKSQKMKTELISNVSHDLKTPLTSIITYVDLLKDENLSEEKRHMYIDTLDRKSERLRVLIEDLFEVSKANSGNVSLNIIDVDVVSLMKQTLLEVDDKLKSSNLIIRKNLPEDKVILKLDSQRTFRVFENLLINISKYAMSSSRVYIDIEDGSDNVKISFKNMTAEEIDFNVDELVERFVRGDKSRNTEGSGLGLAIAKSFVELQGGNFDVCIDGDLFKVVIVFKK